MNRPAKIIEDLNTARLNRKLDVSETRTREEIAYVDSIIGRMCESFIRGHERRGIDLFDGGRSMERWHELAQHGPGTLAPKVVDALKVEPSNARSGKIIDGVRRTHYRADKAIAVRLKCSVESVATFRRQWKAGEFSS